MTSRWNLLWIVALLALAAGAAWCDAAIPAAPGTDVTHLMADVVGFVGAQPAPPALLVKTGDQIAFMGDSITQFGGYVRLTQYLLTKNYPDMPVKIINVGISGQVAENMEPRFVKDMKLGAGTTWCFISVGINDVWHRMNAPADPAVLAAYTVNVTKMVDEAQAAGAKAVLLTPTVINEDPTAEGNKRLVAYVDAEKQIAVDKNCGLIDLHGMFLAAMAAKPKDLRLTRDGVHMARYGDAIMALGVVRALGVPDATFAATDILSALRMGAWDMSLAHAAELLQIPVDRFFQPELSRYVVF